MLVPRLLAALLAAVLVVVAPAPPASAATASCLPTAGGPTCRMWTGKVVRVGDGDTVLVDIAGDGTSTPRWIRLIGAQAMEQTVYSAVPKRRRGECHSLAATARLERLIRAGGGTVRLTAQHVGSSSKSRPLRAVAVKINGGWRDVGQDLIRHGLALWQPFGGEWAWNAEYRLAQARAAQQGTNLFDTDTCGAGPAQVAGLQVLVNYDADGADDLNLNGEWVRVANPSAADVPIGRWWIRDSGLRRYTFPAGTVVPANGALHLHVGSGTATATDQYWGLTAPVFGNPTSDAQALGDGAYLFDPQGDLRAWMQYPCVLACPDPLPAVTEG